MSEFDIIVIGGSLGGLRAMTVLLGGLPAEFALPIVVALHRHTDTDGELAAFLQPYSALPIVEAEDKQALLPGQVALAPSDYHILVEAGSLALSTEAAVAYARPSIDVLFETAADAYGARTIGVILTGASDDGACGMAAIKRQGGLALAQEPANAECPVMPAAAIGAAPIDLVLPLAAIAPYLVSRCCQS